MAELKKKILRFIYKHDLKWKLQQLWTRKIGYRFALWLDKRHPGWCWADTCSYVGMAWNIAWLWRTSDEEKVSACQSICMPDVERIGTCWCGKNMSPEMRAKFEQPKPAEGAHAH